MGLAEALNILKEFQLWRKEESPYDILGEHFKYSTRELNNAIETIIEHVEEELY